MLPFIASENMFKVISLKDLHNYRRNYSGGRKKRENTKLFASVLRVTQAMHNMIYQLATPTFLLHFNC